MVSGELASQVNLSLLSKQLWRIITAPPTSLLSSTLQSKYVDLASQALLKTPYNSSWIWKGIVHDHHLITTHLRWQVGSGEQISLNHPLWWPMQSRSNLHDNVSMVKDLIMHTDRIWNPVSWISHLIHSLYEPSVAATILSLPLSHCNLPDSILWTGNINGLYSAKTGFLLSQHPAPTGSLNPFWKFLWSISLPPKFLLFIWKLIHRSLPSRDVLQHHHIQISLLCSNGCDIDDALDHIFYSCHKSRAI